MGFIPTYLFAFAWAIFHKVPHIAMSDGTLQSEKSLSFIHRFLRRVVFRRSAAFVGASKGSIRSISKLWSKSMLECINLLFVCTIMLLSLPESEKVSDFLFSGQVD
jgi:hypothetical protein